MNYVRLSKEISFALRHRPWEYELEMDEEGYVSINQLLNAINENAKYNKVIDLDDLKKVIEISDKERLEINGDSIRALYGHTIPMHIKKIEATPPAVLYHGTSHKAIDMILNDGIKPMSRQYVHLSIDTDTAIIVGKRRDDNPILLIVDTQAAIKDGHKFYIGNDKVWLADYIPPKYISIKKD